MPSTAFKKKITIPIDFIPFSMIPRIYISSVNIQNPVTPCLLHVLYKELQICIIVYSSGSLCRDGTVKWGRTLPYEDSENGRWGNGPAALISHIHSDDIIEFEVRN